MRITGQALRTWALRCLLAAWTVVFLGVVVPIITIAVQRHADMDAMADALWAGGVAVGHWAQSAWLAWPVGGFLGLVTGFAGGVWLDALVRRKEEPPAPTPVERPLVGGLGDNPPPQLIYLSHVAAMIYGSLGRCFLRDLIDRSDGETLDIVARIISNYCDIWGIRVPSNVISMIEHDEVAELELHDDTLYRRRQDSKWSRPVYRALCMRQRDIERVTGAIMNVRHNSSLQIR